MKRKAFLQTACTLTAVLLLATACTQDELSGGKGEPLPEGKYPMTFATTVEGVTVTRATTDNTWAGGEEVAVQVGTANPKKYTASTDGKLSAATNETPFYWESTTEEKIVSAWYPYTATKPSTFIVKKDQSGTVQSGTDGYQESDLIYAASQKVTYSGSKELTFKHLPVKVVVNLKAGTGVTANEVTNASVAIINQSLTSGAITEGTNTADWSVAQVTSGDVDITPKVITCPADCQKSVQALLVPRQMKGVSFIKVTAGGNDYYYIPTNETDANLRAGKQYTYTITVTKNGLTVTASGVAEWTGTEKDPVTSKVPKAGFAASDLKSGDYYYSDGTWSDGGNREYADDTKMILPIMPVLTNPKTNQPRTVIGIVYWVGNVAQNDTKLKKKLGGDSYDAKGNHALVVALGQEKPKWQATSADVQSWLDNNKNDEFQTVESGKNDALNNIQGYNNTKAIEAFNDEHTGNEIVAAVASAVAYRKTVPAPQNSSDWYLPSPKELVLLYAGTSISGDKNSYNRDLINSKLESVGGTKLTTEPLVSWYWSSTIYSYIKDNALGVQFDSGEVSNTHKTYANMVRFSLAF